MAGFNRNRPLRPLVLIVALSFVVQLAVSAPNREKRAAPACSNEVGSANVKYEVGKTYNYDFESEVVTQIVAGSDEDSRLKVKGQAALAVLSSCEYILTVVKLDLQSHQTADLSAIQKSSLKFTYQNGQIDPESITLAKNDPAWSANVKRTIVSLFHNHALASKDVSSLIYRETDVTGTDCLTKYAISGSTYVKTRDLNHCSKRDGGIWIGQGAPYPNSKPRVAHSAPILKSTQTCTQDFGSGKLNSVTCEETHKLEIYNKGGVGAQTKVTTSLKLTGDAGGNTYAAGFQGSDPVSIAFDHSDDSDRSLEGGAVGSTRKILNELCKEVEGGILGPRAASLYVDLRRQIARTAVNDLRALDGDLTGGKLCAGGEENSKVRVLFQDAAANAGSTSSIEFVSKLYDTLDVRAQELFRLSASFAPGPEESALESFATLLSGGDSRVLLAASGLAHQYCLSTNKNCGSSAAYNSISDGIAAQAKANCGSKDQAQIGKAIAVLQALGNLDSLSENAVTAISDCINSPTPRVVSQALQAFRRDPCQDSLKKLARSKLESSTTASDIRIQGYLALTGCLNEDDALFITNVLYTRPTQVYWFIASHRHNQLHSNNQAKDTSKLKHAFNLIRIPKSPLKPDARKYSTNFDFSMFTKRDNTGASIGGNLIYSADSYIPRTVSGELNLDFLGKSYQLAELGVTLYDFEGLAEQTFKDLLRENEDDDAGTDTSGQRRRREVAPPEFQSSAIEAFQKQAKVNTLRETNGVTDIYARIFGTTVCVNSYLYDDLVKEEEEVVRTLREQLRKGVPNLDFTQGFPYLLDEVVVPTISGFPLIIDLESSAVVSFKSTGEFVEGSSFKTRISPSGSIQTRGRMVTGAGPVEAGLQIEANLHSASDVNLELTMVPGKTKGFNCDAKVNFPRDKTHLVDIRSDLYWVSRSGNEVPVKTAVTSKIPPIAVVDNYCLDTVSQFFGLKYCANLKVASLGGGDQPMFPLTGPVLASFTVEKSDASIKDYLFQIHVDNEENADMHFSLVFDTPGSSKSRKIVLTATGVGDKGSKEKTLDLIIESPWKKLTGTGKYSKSPKGDGVTSRTATFDVKADGTTQVLQTKLSGDYSDKSIFPLSQDFDLDLKYGMQSQHSLTVNTKFAHPNSADLSFEGKVTSSRLPFLNFDFKWDRTFSRKLVKVILVVNQGPNAISLNTNTKIGDASLSSTTDLKVVIPDKKLDITYKGNFNGDAAAMKLDGGFDLNAGIVQANSKYSLDLPGVTFNIDTSASGLGKKLSFKSTGTRSAGPSGGFKGDYTLVLNVEPKVFSVDVKSTATVGKVDGLNKISVQTTTTTSLLPNPISTTLDISSGGSLNVKLATQLNIGNDRIASFSVESKPGAGNAISVNFKTFVQKTVDGDFEFTVGTSPETSMSAKFDLSIIPLGRRIKHEGTLRLGEKGESKSIHYDADVKWDFDKDPKKGVAIVSDTSFVDSSGAFNTKNTLTLSGLPYKLNIEVNPGSQILNEKHSWKLEYQKGDEPLHTIGFDCTLENSEKAKRLLVGAQLDLDSVPSVPKAVNVEVGVSDLDSSAFYFDSLTKVEIVPRGAAAQLLEIELKTKKSDKGRSIKVEVRDDLVFKYGIVATADVGMSGADVKYERTGGGNKLTLVELGVSRGVSGEFQEIKTNLVYDRDFAATPTLKTTGNYLYRFNSIWDFEVREQYSLSDRFSGPTELRNVDSSMTLKISKTDLLLKSSQALKATDWDEKADLELSGKLDGNKFNGLVDVKFTNNSVQVQVVKAELSVLPGFPGNSEFSFTIALPPTVKYQNIELKVKHDELTKGQSYKNLVQSKINDIQIEVNTQVELGPKKSADFALKLNKDPVRKLSLAYDQQGKSVSAKIEWGDEPLTISTSGKVIPVGEGFDVELDFDSPLLPNKRWELKISRRIEGPKRSTRVNLDNPSSKQNFQAGVERTKGDAKNTVSLDYDANLSLPALRGLLQGQKGKVTLTIDRKAFDAAREKAGTQIDLDAALGPITVKFTGKKSDLEGKLSVSVCPGGDCTTGDLLILQGADSFKASADVIRKGIKVGFSAENKKSADGTCDTTAQVFYPLANAQKELGLRVVFGPGQDSDVELSKKQVGSGSSSVKKYGLDVTLGPRTLSLVAAKGNWDSDAADADAIEVRAWLDKAREPARVMALSLTNIMASGDKQGRDIGLVLSHPDFKKDHRLKTSYRFDSAGPSLFDVTTEIDVFKTTADTLKLNTNLKQSAVNGKPAFEIGWSAKSEGQGLSWEVLCSNLKIDGNDRSASCKFDGKSASRGDRNVKWEFSADSNSISSEVTDNDGVLFKFTSAPGSDGLKTTLQVPGMKDSWVREIRRNEDPTGVAYRGYGSSYPPNKYTEAYVGIFSKKKFGGGTRSSDGSAKADLTTYSLEVNRPGPDVILFTWNKAAIQKFLDDTNTRFDAVSKGLIEFVRKRGNDNADRLQKIVSGFKGALPDPSPFIGRVMGVVNELQQEGGGATQGLVAFASRSKRAAGDDEKIKQALSAVTESIANSLEALANSRRAALNKAKALLDQVEQFPPSAAAIQGMKDQIRGAILAGLELGNKYNLQGKSLEEGFAETVLQKARGFVLDTFEDAYDDNLKSWNDALPWEDVDQFLNSLPEYVESALLKPEEDRTVARSDLSLKLSAAVTQLASKAFNADFKKGTISSEIPVAKLLGLGGLEEDIDEDEQTYPGSLSTLLNALLAVFQPRRVLPPVDAIGLAIEGTHYQSFDGVLKPFGTACQYLLASDFADNTFSVAIDIQKKTSRANTTQSLIVTDGKDTISISSGSAIYVNGKKSEPTKVGAFVVKQNEAWTTVRGSMGLKVSCLRSEEKQLCGVQASGYYHGKLRGVLGRFDNDVLDEKTTPDGTTVEGNENFVNSWKLNSDCRGQTLNIYLDNYNTYVDLFDNDDLNGVGWTAMAGGDSKFTSFNGFMLLALLFISFFNYLRN